MKRLSFLCLTVIFAGCMFAQLYVPIDTANFVTRKEISKKYLLDSKQFVTKIMDDLEGKERSYIKSRLEKNHKEFNEELLHGDYIFDNRFDHFVDSIVAELSTQNPMIPNDLKFYISKNLSLNALSMGDNTFVINLGTFYYLDNEEQLAAIISHEIGHFILKHQIQTLKRNFRLDKIDSKSQLSEIKRDKYNRGTKALERYKAIMYSKGSLGKQKEREADSIGYTLFRNSKFHRLDYLNSYILLAEYDSLKPDGLKLETYRKVFDLPNQKFKDEWLKREDFSGYDYTKYKEELNKDSLKSHPETEERIAYLKKVFPELADSPVVSPPCIAFQKLQLIAEFEQAPSLDFNEAYGDGIYLCLLKIQKDSSDQYHKEWLGHFFRKIYDARKAYTLNRYLDRVDPKEQSESYQQFLNFMWNLNVTELKVIADYYNKKDS
jgi:Zn-dependent protease with chaperone function